MTCFYCKGNIESSTEDIDIFHLFLPSDEVHLLRISS